jgi:hypothetical protein
VAKLPRPPATLAGIPAEIHPLTAGTLLWRIFQSAGDHPTAWNTWRAFGPVDARFDHHLDPPRIQQRKILYASLNPGTAFAEVFQRTRVINRRRGQPCLAGFRTARALRLLDLTDAWPTRAGASMAISTGSRVIARQWSRVIYDAYPDLDGLWYGSSMDGNRPCVALYERATDVAPALPELHRLLQDPALRPVVAQAATRLRYRVV